jgi:hypothetical protein
METTCSDSAPSIARPFSTSFIVRADLSMRSVPSTSWSFRLIASVMPRETSSISVMGSSGAGTPAPDVVWPG